MKPVMDQNSMNTAIWKGIQNQKKPFIFEWTTENNEQNKNMKQH